jgi:unsaturated chondroitin disaccharide hydrolase
MYTKSGKWRHDSEPWTHWCEGFFPGVLWLLHMRDRDEWSRIMAERYTRPLEQRRADRKVHDLGFIFLNTTLRWYRLTGDRPLRQVIIEAGRTLSLRFQDKGEYLCSFLGPESLFIDIMMNVPIIYWTARETGDERLRKLANRHCATTARYLVRSDGSCAHEGIFDALTGRFLYESTQQGLRPTSCWARGLAWALYGFGTAYSYSGEGAFLDVAERAASFYLAHTPGGKVPYWDFDVHEGGVEEKVYDSSAAAIGASGLLNLAQLTKNDDRRKSYKKRAMETLEVLASPDFLAENSPDQEGILLHAVYHYNKGIGVDESAIWGDHFFVEALYKVLANVTGVEV